MLKLFLFLVSLSVLSKGQKSTLPWRNLEILNIKEATGSIYPIKLNEGREGFITIFPNQLKLSIFSYKDTEKKVDREDIFLTSSTVDFLNVDIDGDGEDEIICVSSYPHEVTVLKKHNSSWFQIKSFKIDGSLSRTIGSIVFNEENEEIILPLTKNFCLISTIEDEVSYTQDLSPLKIFNSWLSDINSDGKKDLISLLTNQKNKNKLLTYQLSNGDSYLPSKTLLEKNSIFIELAHNSKKLEFFSLDALSKQRNIVQRYKLTDDEVSPFGYQNILPLDNMKGNSLTSTKIEDETIIISISHDSPIINYYKKTHRAWEKINSSPIMHNSTKIAIHPNNPKQLLFLVKSSPYLYTSFLKGKTFSFPKAFTKPLSEADRKIVDLYSDEYHTFWASFLTKNRTLYIQEILKSDEEEYAPNKTKIVSLDFSKFKQKIFQVKIIGNNRVAFTTSDSFVSYATKQAGKTVIKKSLIPKNSFPLLRLTPTDEKNKILSFRQNGCINILNKNLEVQNKIVLPNKQKILGHLFLTNDSILAITSKFNLLKLEKGENGIFSTTETLREKVSANKIIYDANLQHIFANKKQILTLESGKELKLKPIEGFSSEIGTKPTDNRRAFINNIHPLDIDGDKEEELFLFDYINHTITILDVKNKTKKLYSWRVFDSIHNKMDYNPSHFLTLDFNGDKQLDLVLRTHDKILCYLSKNEQNN